MKSLVTITYFTCPEWLRRRGMLLDGGPIPEPISDVTRVTIAEIKEAVARGFGLPLAEMTSARRAKEVAQPRQVAMWLSKQLTPRSLPEIGRHFGGRDHTTVIWACQRVEERLRRDLELREKILEILAWLLGTEAAHV